MLALFNTARDTLYTPKFPRRVSFCITLRQWSILFSILMFIFTAFCLTCAILGYMHVKNTTEILDEDINNELEKLTRNYSENAHINHNNGPKLISSKAGLNTLGIVLKFCMVFGWSFILLSGFLIYGITMRSTKFMIPWIFCSIVCYISAVLTELLLFSGIIDCFDYRNNNIISMVVLSVSLIFFGMWCTIFIYFLNLRERNCANHTQMKPLVVRSNGVYSHAIKLTSTPKKNSL